jgi:hypothetical protein
VAETAFIMSILDKMDKTVKGGDPSEPKSGSHR